MRTGEVFDLIRTFFKKVTCTKKSFFHSYRAQILHSVQSTAFEDDKRRESRLDMIDNKSVGYREPPCGGRWLASARRKESACIKSYRLYTILDNHTYGSIYSSHNLSLHLYYTHSPSPDFRRELPPQGAKRAFPLNETSRKSQFVGELIT